MYSTGDGTVGWRLRGRDALLPAGAVFLLVGIVFAALNYGQAKLGFLVYLMILVALLGAIMLLLKFFASEQTQNEFLSVWMPGYIFFAVGTSFFWAGYGPMEGHEEQGRVMILGGISGVLGTLVLLAAIGTKLVYWNNPEKGKLRLGRILGALGLTVAALVLLGFYALGIVVIAFTPDKWIGGIVLMAIPTVFLAIFGTIFYFKRRSGGGDGGMQNFADRHAELRDRMERMRGD